MQTPITRQEVGIERTDREEPFKGSVERARSTWHATDTVKPGGNQRPDACGGRDMEAEDTSAGEAEDPEDRCAVPEHSQLGSRLAST